MRSSSSAFRYGIVLLLTALASPIVSGCGSGPSGEEQLGSISLAVSQTPADVGCIRMTVTGSRTVVRTFDVVPGRAVILNLTGLPVGTGTFVGEGFPDACSGLTGLSVASWTTDPVVANVTTSDPPRLALVFHRNGRAAACLDWEDDPASAVRLTSVTLDPEDATGTTTNAPGAWSTNTADPLSQLLVIRGGVHQNQGASTGSLGEVDLPLEYGVNSLTLAGNGVFPSNPYYGAVLFFDGVATPPQIAVYSANGGDGAFLVQPAGTTIIGSANGGLFFDVAPGSSVYTSPNGTRVEVLSYAIDSLTSTTDLVGFGTIWSDGTPDTIASLVLNVTPACP